ncbi:MAG: SpoIIE family protein phosphatase [Pirellulales bacterium]
MRIGYKISLLVFGTAILATSVLTLIGYSKARRQYIAGVDQVLTAAVAALPRVIGDDYLRRAMDNGELSDNEYNAMVATLSDLADRSRVYYVYAFAEVGNEIVNLATSASAAERAAGDWATFRQPYERPPESLLATFRDGQTRFAEYVDEFGEFRSVFVRLDVPGKGIYVVGVDVSLAQIHSHLRNMIWQYLTAGTLVSLLAGTLGIWIAKRIAQPVRELSQEVDAWSGRDFSRNDVIRTHLQQLALDHRDEVGELAGRFVEVQDRLQTYLQHLTETTVAKQKIEHQLEIAKTIQESLLPQEVPKIENFQVMGWSQPADQTGGDYFDWLELSNGNVLLTIGDVTGHGIGPALVTAAARAYARATIHADEALDATISRLNDLLHGDLKGERFVTLVACLLDPRSRQLKLIAAGHGPAIFYSRRRDEVDVISDTHGLPLGIIDQGEYDQPMRLQFEPGDALVLVSDGFFEWSNANGEVFGTDRLRDSILASCRDVPDQVIDRLRRDVAAFHGGTSQADDTTALSIRCVS